MCKVFGDISREEREDRADDGKDESSDKQPATAESRGDGEVRAIRVSKQREIDDGFERQGDGQDKAGGNPRDIKIFLLRRGVDGGDKSLEFDVVVGCSQEGRRESNDCWCEEHVERSGAEGVGGEGSEGETRGRILLVCWEYGVRLDDNQG